jgi:hypothetical protein
VCGGGWRRRRRRRSPGYRIKNKNTTQRCGEYHIQPSYINKIDKSKEQSKIVETFKEEESLNMQCFFLQKCGLPFRNLFGLRSIIKYFSQK